MAKKIFNKRTLAILLTLVMLLNGFQLTASAAGANGSKDERGNWTYAYYLGQEYLGNGTAGRVKPDPVGYGFQGVITSLTFTDDARTSWTFNWSNEANGEWRITGSNVSQASASAWPQITDGKVYVGYCGDKAYTFTLGHEGSSEDWTYARNNHANWFRYIRFIREYTVNVFYQNETGTIQYNGETFAAADPVTGSFQFLYPNGNIIDDSEYEDGEYTEPTTLLPADYLPQSMIDLGYEIKYATDADGKNVLRSGVTISLLGDNVLNVYCTLIPPATEDYSVIHNYYVEGTYEGTQSGGTIEVTEGSNFNDVVAGITKLTTYNGSTYAYISYAVDPDEKVITLTYNRTLPTYDYTVIYDANFGENETKADPENVTGSKATSKNITVDANTFIRANYYFAGWNTERDGSGTAYAADSTIALTAQNNTEILYAQWQEYPKYDYIVTYNANFGSNETASDEENVTQVYDASKSITVNDNMFSRPNYTFLGWALEADGEVIYQAGSKISFTTGGSEELFAIWQEFPKYDYTVTYNADFGAEPATASDEENVAQVYNTSKTITINGNMFTHANHDFVGWATESGGEVVYQPNDKISFIEGGSQGLFAVWQEYPKYSYALSYNGNGGLLADGQAAYADEENVNDVYNTAYSIKVNDNTFTREHYTFIGWNTKADGSGISYSAADLVRLTPSNNTAVLYAQWQENPKYDYTVIYNANFGETPVLKTDEENAAQVYDTSKIITVNENDFVHEHYTFIGWALEADGEVVYQAGDEISFVRGGSEELFAVWQEHPKYDYTVKYSANFGLFPATEADEENITDTYAAAYSIEVNDNPFTRANHTFIGWSETKNGEVIFHAGDQITFTNGGEKTLYAQWIEHDKYSYTVVYNGNGGAAPGGELAYGDSENVAETYATAHTVEVDGNTFLREHYTFAGWNTAADGTGIAYTAEDLIALTAENNTETLYAQWILDNEKYTVEYKVSVDEEPYEDFTGELPEGAPTDITVPYGTDPEIDPPTSLTDDSYTYDFVEVEVEGNVIVVYYHYTTPEIIEIPEEEVPLAPEPEIPEEEVPQTPEPEIPEEEVPQAPEPEVEDDGLVELPDEEVPLADVPKTGDMTVLYAALTALSGMGLAALGLKKKEETEE